MGPSATSTIATSSLPTRLGDLLPSLFEVLDAQIREFDDIAIVTCLQEMDIPFVPDLPSFVIQAAVTRVWIRTDEEWRLVHLQMARRLLRRDAHVKRTARARWYRRTDGQDVAAA